MFSTLVSMASNNMCSYVSLIEIIKAKRLTENDRGLKLLGDHSMELKQFAKEEKISANNGEELARLLDYYHELLEQDL